LTPGACCSTKVEPPSALPICIEVPATVSPPLFMTTTTAIAARRATPTTDPITTPTMRPVSSSSLPELAGADVGAAVDTDIDATVMSDAVGTEFVKVLSAARVASPLATSLIEVATDDAVTAAEEIVDVSTPEESATDASNETLAARRTAVAVPATLQSAR